MKFSGKTDFHVIIRLDKRGILLDNVSDLARCQFDDLRCSFLCKTVNPNHAHDAPVSFAVNPLRNNRGDFAVCVLHSMLLL